MQTFLQLSKAPPVAKGATLWLFSVLLMLSCHANASDPCVDTGERFTFGSEPLASRLYEAALDTEQGAWEDETFWQERFYFLGSTLIDDVEFYVTYVDTTWGISSCRRTVRLMFFTKAFTQFAQYYGIGKPDLNEGVLSFLDNDAIVSEVDISEGFPVLLYDGNEHVMIEFMN